MNQSEHRPPQMPLNSSHSSPSESKLESLLNSLYRRINYERQSKAKPHQFRLQNLQEFLRRLGNPHFQYPIVHVAGTKGKGSVVSMIGEVLRTSNHRTGVYVSPHLETINQRIALNGVPISDDQLAETLAALEPVARELDEESTRLGLRSLTFFEVITAAAFYYFWKQNVQAVVLEVGLGGRMDSTNVCLPVVSVITNISFDHTRQLGNTLEKIAAEKAGIIKPKVQVVSGVTTPGPIAVIAEVAGRESAPLAVLDRDFSISRFDRLNESFTVSGAIGNYRFTVTDLRLKMLGAHQRNNAAIAVAACQSLNQQGWQISEAHIRDGLASAGIAGRTEIVSRRPLVMLDIAHNVASVNALANTIRELPEWKSAFRKTLIMAVSEEKDAAGMLTTLLKVFDHIVFTKYQNNPRGIPANELMKLAQAQIAEQHDTVNCQLGLEPDPMIAWRSVRDSATDNDFICVAGSAFLIAEVRPLTIKRQP